MKILFTADWHVSERHGMGGAKSSLGLYDFGNAIDQVVEALTDYSERVDGVDMVVHLGDVFDRPRPTPREYAEAMRAFDRIAEHVGEVWVLEGNHDRDATQQALVPLSMGQYVDHICVPTSEPVGARVNKEFFSVNETQAVLHFLPYPPPSARLLDQWTDKAGRNAELGAGLDLILEDMARKAEAQPDVKHILCAHVTFAGSRYNETRTVGQWDLAVPTDALGYFDAVFCGHLHVRQPIGHYANAHYVGPLTRWSFSDEGIPTGFCIYDTETGETEWIDIEGGIRFATYPADFLGLDGSRDFQGRRQNMIARFVGEVSDVATYERYSLVVQSMQSEFAHIRNDVTIAKAEGQLRQAETDSVRDVFDAYCEARPDAVDEELREEVVQHVESVMREVR